MSARVLSTVAGGALLLLTGGCTVTKPLTDVFTTPNQPFHKDPNPAKGLELGGNATLRVVEMDDQGELWSPAQLKGVVDEIKRLKAPEGALVLVFVHGWNNSANPDHGGGNLYSFRETVRKMGDAMQELPPGDRQHVYGVFIGWRGRTFKHFPVGFDYFQRRASGQGAGGAGGTFALMDILEAARSNPKNSPVVVGHSFGALMVERALAPVIVADVARRKSKPVADLILLINEAENALTAHKLMVALKDKAAARSYHKSPYAPPLIVSIASDSDWATRSALPAGAFIGRSLVSLTNTTNSGKLRPEDAESAGDGGYPAGMSQRTALYHAPAHIDQLHSHQELKQTCKTCIGGHEYGPLIKANQHPVVNGRLVIHGSNGDYELMPKDRPWNDTPYWVFRVPKEFLDNHNGLWDEKGGASGNVVALITALAALGDEGVAPAKKSRLEKAGKPAPIRQSTPMTYKK